METHYVLKNVAEILLSPEVVSDAAPPLSFTARSRTTYCVPEMKSKGPAMLPLVLKGKTYHGRFVSQGTKNVLNPWVYSVLCKSASAE